MNELLAKLFGPGQQTVYSDIDTPKSFFDQPLETEGRYTFLPFKDTMEGSVFNERQYALPGLLAEAVNAFTAPKRALLGGLDEVDAPNMALNMMGGGLLASKAAPTPQGGKDLGSFLFNTPTKPNPTVGTRFETEFLGGLADQRPVNLQDYIGSSLMIMPWDSTSRNVAVKSISDVNLPSQQVTHGGQDYARDLIHQAHGIAGASGEAIAKRIRDREVQAIRENLAAGGTGGILHLPTTMGAMAENFSVMPTNILLDVISQAKPTKASLKELNNMVKNAPIYKKGAKTFPFKNFKGVDTEAGRQQLFSGEGLDTTAGELRKMFVEKMYLKGNQEKFKFNAEDIINSITDPNLRDVPKGFVGNTIIQGSPDGMRLSASQNPSYNTDFTGRYLGTLGQSIPAEVLLPKRFAQISGEMSGKLGDLRTNTLGALEKRKAGVSELIDDEFLSNLQRYMSGLR